MACQAVGTTLADYICVQRIQGRFVYGATDLNNFLECKRLTGLEELVALGKLVRPEVDDPQGELIKRKGDEHEQRYLQAMQEKFNGGVVCFARSPATLDAYRTAEAETLRAMREGAPIIYQATFFDGDFVGHADFLRRIETPSDLGAYSYEVIDTKLALTTRPYYLIQLCNYSEHLARLQGTPPARGYIILGDGTEEAFRLHDYLAYYRHLKTSFLTFVGATHDEYPYERKHCAVCPWDAQCTQKRRDDDHLSLVAWMRRAQVDKLEEAGITTLAQLATAPDDARPSGTNPMTPETFTKLRRQAKLQLLGRTERRPLYEILAPEPAMGFALLPEPAAGDVYFDMEGDPLYEPGRGLEYLFGFWLPGESPEYRAFWAHDRAEEKAAFEAVVDFLLARRADYPAMHVYHYADYEKSALRRLAQLHGTREDEIDDLLRGEVFVDLFAVVRQSLVVSEESYGLKAIEHFYELTRATETIKGDQSIVMFEKWLLERSESILSDIENYNRDDCRSTYLLREWLLARRDEAIAEFKAEIDFRPLREPSAPCHPEFVATCKTCQSRAKEERDERRRSELERTFLARDDATSQLLAHLLAYHRREEKPGWWAYYDRIDHIDDLFEFDKDALAKLTLRDDIEPYALDRSRVFTYEFPDQQHKMAPGKVRDPRTKRVETIVRLDEENNLIELKRTGTLEAARSVRELIPDGPPAARAQKEALLRIGEAYAAGTLEREHPATYDLLLNRNPRLAGGRAELQPAFVSVESILDVVRALDRSYLFIQGPPGSGKTTYGSQIICDLLAAGKRVAVMSTAHKAAQHLLHKVEECMELRKKRFVGLYKHSNGEDHYVSTCATPCITSTKENADFEGDGYQLAGGTSWLFARAEMVGAFDYIFIDEAGQVALANALAVSPCAKNVVLLGDPSQLAQVSQGSHPLGADTSVLQYLLGDAQTVPKNRGVFLDVSYRMQPEICAFISQSMYAGRLRPDPKTAGNHVSVDGERRAGLEYLAVAHDGNSSSSIKEADRIVEEIARMHDSGVREDEIIVVTPYNAQRRKIAGRLRDAGLRVRVGTVDKFQGQEAKVVLYSMATSSGDDIPRSTQFLFERNRFNVAVSRAQALSILVCSPQLLDVSCRTPDEMALVNLLCAFVEQARPVSPLSTACGV